MNKKFIPSLNGLRALSIFMVVGYHFGQSNFLSTNSVYKYIGWLIFNGPLGVNIFFIISGFLITTLLIAEKKKNGFISLKNFYIRRTIRIFPAYYVFVTAIFILQLLGYFNLPLPAWIAMITYTKQFFSSYGHETAHLWSLSVEEFFYLFWPICFIKIKDSRQFLFSAISLVVILRFTLYHYPLANFTNTIFTTGDALLIGCLIATEIQFFQKVVSRFKRVLPFTPFAIYICILINNYLYHLGPGDISAKINFIVLLQKLSYTFLGNIGLITNLLLGLFIVYCVFSRGVIFNILNTSVVNYFGLLSYSIYLWQQLFTADREWLHRLPAPVIVLIIIGIALLSYHLIELPLLKIKHRFESFGKQKSEVKQLLTT